MGILIATALAAALATTAYFLWRKYKKPPPPQPAQPNYQDLLRQMREQLQSEENEERSRQQAEAREREAREEEQRRRGFEQRRKEQIVKAILNKEPMLEESMLKKAGLGHVPRQTEVVDEQAIRSLAERLSNEWLQLFSIAAAQNDLNFDLRTVTERLPVEYPTRDIQPEQMWQLEQFPQMLPEQCLVDDEEFYRQMADQSLLILQPFETIRKQKLLYMLIDGSGSMKEPMARGLPKHYWARGIALNLLLRAVKGEAQYFLRIFDEQPHELLKATSPEEARRLIDKILSLNMSDGGTCIFNAFKRALEDRKRLGGEVSQADILIISDGEDQSMDETAKIKQMMGEETRLHGALLGADSPALKALASSYRTFS